MQPKILTKQEVINRIEDLCKPYVSNKAAAKAFGITPSQLTNARLDREPPPPKLLRRIGVMRESLYVTDLEPRFRDGAMSL